MELIKRVTRYRWCWIVPATLIAVACATVPMTGRSQFLLVTNQQLARAADQQFAAFIGALRQQNALLSTSESSEAAKTIELVNRVSDRIVDAAGLRGALKWQTIVVKNKVPNAFVMPNGKICVFTGILSVTTNEPALAAVLGHEVAHVVAQHAAERMSQVMVASMLINAVDKAMNDSKYRPIIGAALGLGAQYGVLMPFSREHESEADRIGLYYMAKAGYDPSEAIGLWERMEGRGGRGPWEFVSTHPSPATRRTQIREWLPDVMAYYRDPSRPLPVNLRDERREQPSGSSPLTPMAERPIIQPGFWYRVQASNRPAPSTIRLERMEACPSGECLVFGSDGGGTTVYAADHSLVEIRRSDGSWFRFSPPLQFYQWPLRVGGNWSGTVIMNESSGRIEQTTFKASVSGYEPVVTPAGSFMAFKILMLLNDKPFREMWYAPEARTEARLAQYDGQGQVSITELLDYQKSDESAASLR